MWPAERLRHLNIRSAETLPVATLFVEVNKDDPRTTAQFLDDTLEIILLSPVLPSGPEFDTSSVDFSIERPSDRKCLDDEISLALHRFYGSRGKAVKQDSEYSFVFQDNDLKTVLDDTRAFLETSYGISDDIDTSLTNSEHIKAWMANTHRWSLPAFCLQATKRALLIKRYNELPGNLISKRKEQKAIIEELIRYSDDEFEHITR